MYAFAVCSLLLMIAVAFGVGGVSGGLRKWVTYISPWYRFGDFILGAVTGYYFLNSQRRLKQSTYTVVEIITIVLVAIQVHCYDRGLAPQSNWSLSLFWLPTSLVLVYILSRERGLISSVFSRCRPLIWIGNISGDAFLIHQIAIKMCEMVTDNTVILTVVSFLITIIGVYLWRLLYETMKLWVPNPSTQDESSL